MAEQLYLITKTGADAPVRHRIDGVYACLSNQDDGGTDNVKMIAAEAQCRLAGVNLPLNRDVLLPGYFDTVIGPINDLAAGPFADDNDTMVFKHWNTQTVQGP